MYNGISQNLQKTFNIDNFNNFIDKDTSFMDKVAYANEATKTAATIYGTYKMGQSAYNQVSNSINKYSIGYVQFIYVQDYYDYK